MKLLEADALSFEGDLKEIVYIDLKLINVPSFDVRFHRSESFISRLAEDIELESFPTPIIVRRLGSRFDPIDGYTRVLAYRKLGRSNIPAIIVSLEDDVEACWKRLKLGINHHDIDAMGVANALLWLRKKGVRQKDIASRMKWSKGYVSKLVKIARRLPDVDRVRLSKGEITIAQAYSFVSGEPYSPALDEEKSFTRKLKCEICGEEKEEQAVSRLKVCWDCQSFLLRSVRKRAKQTQLDEAQKKL